MKRYEQSREHKEHLLNPVTFFVRSREEAKKMNRFAQSIDVSRFHLSTEEFHRLIEEYANAIRRGIGSIRGDKLKKPAVTISIPVLNEGLLTLRCLEAIALQANCPSTEVICVDNGSTDITPYLLDACGVEVVRESCKGQWYMRTASLDAAQGEIYIMTDADTVFSPSLVKSYTDFFDQDSGDQYVATTGPTLFYTKKVPIITAIYLREWLKRTKMKHNVPHGSESNSAFRTKFAQEVGFDKQRKVRYGLGGILTRQLIERYGKRIGFVEEAVAFASPRRVEEQGLTRSIQQRFLVKMIQDVERQRHSVNIRDKQFQYP